MVLNCLRSAMQYILFFSFCLVLKKQLRLLFLRLENGMDKRVFRCLLFQVKT